MLAPRTPTPALVFASLVSLTAAVHAPPPGALPTIPASAGTIRDRTATPERALGQEGYELVFEELRDMAPRADRLAVARNLVLRRDAVEFRLEEGSLVLLTPVAGRSVAAVFVGVGAVAFRPPLEVERAQLRRVLGDSAIDAPITSAVFIFADSTLLELERHLTFGTGTVAEAAAGAVNDALAFLLDERSRQVDGTLMTALLNGDANGYFAAYAKRQRGEGLMFKLDPHEVEAVMLLRRGRFTGQEVQTVCQFQRTDHRGDSGSASVERPEPLSLGAYQIETRIAENLDFAAVATMRLTARPDSVRWARFILYHELDVDSVTGAGSTAAHFFRAKRSPELWVRFDPPIRRAETRTIRVAYHGDLIVRGSLMEQFLPPRSDPRRARMPIALDRWLFIKATGTWFPRYSFWQPADMELTFRTPSRYRFASIGRTVESRVEGNIRTTRWVTEAPTQQASFNIGEFDEFEIKDPRIPPVTVHLNAEAHRHLPDIVGLQQRDPQEQVGGDVANSLAFFTEVFGPPLFQRYFATEIPYGHGQAFPGLIHLSWWTFQTVEERGASEMFRAHEMAHQWWGIGVEPADYRDAWLSEGFATFAGLWYMQVILKDNEKYFNQLDEWGKALRSARAEAPPIGLGYRVTETDPEDYDLIVYRKGAWVLHMLRNLMLNTRTMDERLFTAMMRDFYQTYRGRHASTKDFQEMVERHVGLSMAWFFNQWVYGTAIPTYVLAWRAEPMADGRHTLRVRVRQEDVPEGFIMPVPLIIEFADGQQAMVRVHVRGRVTEAELPLPEAPTRLELNPLHSVLAEVRQERWR